jgi:hypothetical protein
MLGLQQNRIDIQIDTVSGIAVRIPDFIVILEESLDFYLATLMKHRVLIHSTDEVFVWDPLGLFERFPEGAQRQPHT